MVCVKHHFCWDRICPMAEKMKDLWKNVGAAQDECNNNTLSDWPCFWSENAPHFVFHVAEGKKQIWSHISRDGGSTIFCTAKNIVKFLSIRLNHHLKIIQSDKNGSHNFWTLLDSLERCVISPVLCFFIIHLFWAEEEYVMGIKTKNRKKTWTIISFKHSSNNSSK